jgi:predicted phage-related endonuclease
LTKEQKSDIIKSTAQERSSIKKELSSKIKLQKSSEKGLTNEEKCGIIKQLITHKELRKEFKKIFKKLLKRG